MIVWTLYILLVMPDGSTQELQGHSYPTETQCKHVAREVMRKRVSGLPTLTACQRITNV